MNIDLSILDNLDIDDFDQIINLLNYSEHFEFTPEQKMQIVNQIMHRTDKIRTVAPQKRREITIGRWTFINKKDAMEQLGLNKSKLNDLLLKFSIETPKRPGKINKIYMYFYLKKFIIYPSNQK